MTTTRRAFQVSAATMASPPVSINEAARTVELIIATEAPAQGEILSCQPGAVTWAAAPVPVLLDHTNKTTNMAGRITSVRFSNGQLIGTAQFTEAPAADIGWQLAKAGCGVSVGASFMPADVTAQGLTDRVNRWRLLEVSLTPVPVDTATTTRSIQTANPEDLMTDTTAQSRQGCSGKSHISRIRVHSAECVRDRREDNGVPIAVLDDHGRCGASCPDQQEVRRRTLAKNHSEDIADSTTSRVLHREEVRPICVSPNCQVALWDVSCAKNDTLCVRVRRRDGNQCHLRGVRSPNRVLRLVGLGVLQKAGSVLRAM